MKYYIASIFLMFSGLIFAQPANDNCADAEFLCPNVTVSGTNVDATVQICAGCQDEYFACIFPNNTVWYKFKTNSIGGIVTIDLNNIVYVTEPGRMEDLDVVVYSFTSECIPSTYGTEFDCAAGASIGGANSFTLNSNALNPDTEYYIVINGNMLGAGITLPGQATFDIEISGPAVERPNPTINITTADTSICNGDIVTLQASKSDCVIDSTYIWTINGAIVATTNVDTFQTNAISDNDYVAVYSVCDTLCQLAIPIDSIQFDVLTLTLDAGSDQTILAGNSVNLNGSTNSTNFTVDWVPGSSLSNSTVLDPIASPTTTTIYFMTISDTLNGCADSDSVTITVDPVLKIPDTFTPNGDGYNDTWEIIKIEEYPDCEIIVYNRWGAIVFQSNGYPQSKWWNGESKSGKDLSPGAYFYFIDLNDPEHPDPYRGTINLVR